MRASPSSTPTKRLYILAILLLVWIGIICFRLFRLQVVKYGDFMARAQCQQNRTIPVEPRRGNIYDRNGVLVAISSHTDEFSSSRAWEAGFNEFLSKPVSASLVLQVIRRTQEMTAVNLKHPT